MKKGFILSAIGLVFVGSLVLSSCTRTVYVIPKANPQVTENTGPPPHAPANGYRYHYGKHYLIYDAHLRVYRVENLDGYYWYDGRYYRRTMRGWGTYAEPGPWRTITVDELPGGLRPHPDHAGNPTHVDPTPDPTRNPTDGGDKDNNGNAWGKHKDDWKNTGKTKDEVDAAKKDAHGKDNAPGQDKKDNDDERARRAQRVYGGKTKKVDPANNPIYIAGDPDKVPRNGEKGKGNDKANDNPKNDPKGNDKASDNPKNNPKGNDKASENPKGNDKKDDKADGKSEAKNNNGKDNKGPDVAKNDKKDNKDNGKSDDKDDDKSKDDEKKNDDNKGKNDDKGKGKGKK